MSAATRARVLEAAADLDYVANARAQALRQSKSGAIGLIVPDVNNSVFAELLSGVQDATSRHNTDVLLGQIDPNDRPNRRLNRLVREGRVDGILIQRREDYDDQMLAELLRPSLPAITINSRVPSHIGSVILDDESGAKIATDYLISLGHRRIAMISGTTAHDSARRREDGFRAAMAAGGLAVLDKWVISAGWEAPAGAMAVQKLEGLTTGLGRADSPTALLVASVNAALGVLATVQRLGLHVPEDISILAINTTWVSETIHPRLSTVRMPLRELGSVAASALLEHLAGADLADIVVGEPRPELLIRDTTAPPR